MLKPPARLADNAHAGAARPRLGNAMIQEKPRESGGRDLLPADRPAARDAHAEPIPFDRRRARRDPADGTMMASFTSEESGITLARVELRDSSRVGAALRCPLRVAPGTRFSLYRDGRPLTQERGIVARCLESKDQFILGLRFDASADAAA